jgi:hypothetical protein
VRKSGGVYYTPAPLVDYIIEHTVARLLQDKTPAEAARLKIVDPACGGGAFLLRAYQCLLDWHLRQYVAGGPDTHREQLVHDGDNACRLSFNEKRRILIDNIFGVDIDPQAVEIAKRAFALKLHGGESHEKGEIDLAGNFRCGNALVGPDFLRQSEALSGGRSQLTVFDWHTAFPTVFVAGGFDAVIGNPPWGQKTISDGVEVKHYLQKRYPSSRGIYDLYRPFVEKSVLLLREGGALGLVLPDIVLLKNYEPTRRFLLESLSLERIDWWGSAFAAATIDAATIVGVKAPPGVAHRVTTAVRDSRRSFSQSIPQQDFWANPRLTFNLFLTPEKRAVLARLRRHPRLGDVFEVHEGVHSGNLRAELFVDSRLDATCRELYFGRGEIMPYRLAWQGKYVRLGAMPPKGDHGRYANVGKPTWYEQPKILVRRTGDRVLAAVDRAGRYASNNFFLVLPVAEHTLTLDGLSALLNSRFMTWYFRAIEPRRGRAFAELKIKHLASFPLPADRSWCTKLNAAGKRRDRLADDLAGAATEEQRAALSRKSESLDARIDELVREAFELPEGITWDS